MWNRTDTTPTLWAKAEGWNTLIVSDINGCKKELDSTYIALDFFDTTSFLGADTSFCMGNEISINCINSNTYTWSSEGEQCILSPSATNKYLLTVVNAHNCISKDSIIVTIKGNAPIITIEKILFAKEMPQK
ncbi:MAG: hypothetical protein IPO21_01260 [Bacteroidales bacterium]|nr:hypothetical protein [Bacteroidales bacterium]